MTDHPQVQAPGAAFNFAQHLIERNTSRPAKIAYIDDQGSLSYGDLDRPDSPCGRRPACPRRAPRRARPLADA